jgi:hypothetical protein
MFVSEKQDVFTLSYGLAVGAAIAYWSAIQELRHVLGHGVLLMFLGGVAVLAVAFFLLQALVRHVWAWRWRRIVSLIVMPFVVTVPLLGALGQGIDASWLRLQVTKPFFLADLPARMLGDTAPRLLAWNWDIGGTRDGYDSEASLVYDESDEFANAHSGWSTALKERMAAPEFRNLAGFRNSFSGDGWIKIRRLDGHFYLVTEIYD